MSYNLVYGSLGTLLALLSWVYVASLLVLGGAHLAAAMATHTRGLGAGPGESEGSGPGAPGETRTATTPLEEE